jgi:hypothetical protein
VPHTFEPWRTPIPRYAVHVSVPHAFDNFLMLIRLVTRHFDVRFLRTCCIIQEMMKKKYGNLPKRVHQVHQGGRKYFDSADNKNGDGAASAMAASASGAPTDGGTPVPVGSATRTPAPGSLASTSVVHGARSASKILVVDHVEASSRMMQVRCVFNEMFLLLLLVHAFVSRNVLVTPLVVIVFDHTCTGVAESGKVCGRCCHHGRRHGCPRTCLQSYFVQYAGMRLVELRHCVSRKVSCSFSTQPGILVTIVIPCVPQSPATEQLHDIPVLDAIRRIRAQESVTAASSSSAVAGAGADDGAAAGKSHTDICF